MSKLTRYCADCCCPSCHQYGTEDADGEYVLYTDAMARHEQLLAALNDLITAVENDDHVFLALSHAKEQAEKLKEI